MVENAFLIPLVLLVAAGAVALGGWHAPRWSRGLAIAAAGYALVHAAAILFTIALAESHAPIRISLGDVLPLGDAGWFRRFSPVTFQIDGLSALLSFLVTLIGFLAPVVASADFVRREPGEGPAPPRCPASILLVTSMTVVVVMTSHLLLLLLAWGVAGGASSLLVGHGLRRQSTPQAIPPREACARAFIGFRACDLVLLFALLGLYATAEAVLPGRATFDLNGWLANLRACRDQGTVHPALLTSIGYLFVAGVAGRTALWPFHAWLPGALGGLAPGNALAFLACLIVAGTSVLFRVHPLLTPGAGIAVAYAGGVAALAGASVAAVQHDLRRILAYATVSQIGYAMLAFGIGLLGPSRSAHAWPSALFHIVAQVLSLACLALAFGSLARGVRGALGHLRSGADPWDIRHMGGWIGGGRRLGLMDLFLLPFSPFLGLIAGSHRDLWRQARMPMTTWCLAVSAMALAGMPFFSGFLSRGNILAETLDLAQQRPQHVLLVLLGFGASLGTAFLMARTVHRVLSGPSRLPEQAFHCVTESPRSMTVPMGVLAVLCLWAFFHPDPSGFSSDAAQVWFLRAAPFSGASGAVTPSPGSPSSPALSVTPDSTARGAEAMSSNLPGPARYAAIAVTLLAAFLGLRAATRPCGHTTDTAFEPFATLCPRTYQFLLEDGYSDRIYAWAFVRPVRSLSALAQTLDEGILDPWLVNPWALVAVLASRVHALLDDLLLDRLVTGASRGAGRLGRVPDFCEERPVLGFLACLVAVAGAVALLLLFLQTDPVSRLVP
jgi:NADH-quinone oxidoreductase subunit L